MKTDVTPVGRYFDAIRRAFDGLDIFLRQENSPLYHHDLIGTVVEEYLGRLRGSFDSWRNRIAFADRFRISQAESGFPAFQNVLELENDRRESRKRLAAMPDADTIRQEMVDFILKKKEFPGALQETNAQVALPAGSGEEGIQTSADGGSAMRGSGAGVTAGSGFAVQGEVGDAGPDSNRVPVEHRDVVERYFSAGSNE